jgi:sarcosine oxidase, subunit beta
MAGDRTCDVLVVGAGVAGTALALELAGRGHRVVLADRAGVCAGSSGLNAGGLRVQFGQESNIRAAAATIRRVAGLREELGEDVAFRRTGYLFLFDTAEHGALLEGAVAAQNAWDQPTRVVGRAEIAELVPGLRTDDLLGAAYSPTDGYVDPRAVVTALGRAAARAGVEIVEGFEVTGATIAGQRVTSVTSARGERISAAVVVNAAGAWAPGLAARWGGDLPIRPTRAQAFVWDRAPVGGRLTPLTIDYGQGVYFHSEGRGLLSGISERTEQAGAPPWSVEPDPAWVPEVHRRLAHRLPEMADARLAHSWAGFIEATPDDNPVIGWTHHENVYTIAGFSGHGMCLAPGLAPEAAREIGGEPARLRMDLYRLDRFEKGTSEAETVWGGRHEGGGALTHGGPWKPGS